MSVLAARLLQISGTRDDHFGVALLISLAVHAAMLAVHFASPPPSAHEATLEVTLLNVRGDTAPLRAKVIAQYDFHGGGDTQSGVASTPLPFTAPDTPDEVVLAALRKRQRELEAEQQR